MAKPTPKFAHLHQHTAYSLLDGAARIKDLIAWVKEVSPEDPTIAMTDHGNMHGAVEFYKTATAAGVKPILGFEAYVTAGSRFERRKPSSKLDGGYFHLTLVGKKLQGLPEPLQAQLAGVARGLLHEAACGPRAAARVFRRGRGAVGLPGGAGSPDPAGHRTRGGRRDAAKKYLDIYGDNFFIELQDHGIEDQPRLNQMLKELANKYGLGMVATNDGHYVKKEDARAHEALLAIQTKTVLSDPNRFKFPCDEFYVKTPEEMLQVIPDAEYPGALQNSVTVADMCDVVLPVGDARVYQMPELPIPEGRTLAEQLRIQSYEGLVERYEEVTEELYRDYLACSGESVPENMEAVYLKLAQVGEKGRTVKKEGQNFDTFTYPCLESFREKGTASEKALTILERAEFELGVIIAMGFPDYFLIVADFINWAKDNGIAVGPGRGSGAGSIVAFATGITNIDPLEFDLLFERFLNPDRVSMPDFDVDFSDVRRNEVIDYVRQKYGEEKVAQIATFGTMASKAAIRDAARVLEAPYADADAVSKLIPVVFGRSTPIARAMDEVPEIKQRYDQGAKEFVDVAMALEGLTRHASVHAAGVIIAREPVQELAPVFRSGDGPIVCQYDMSSVEDLGFIKMDFLGLRTLSFIEAAVKIIRDSRGIELDPDTFPAGDEKTFELLSRGEAAGVFQFESPGMIDTLRKLKPRRIQDLIAVSALYRPGPMENIPTYIRRHHGADEDPYVAFPESRQFLETILEETYGIPVYQEQIMQIAQAVAGYSLGEADLLRRAMGKKKVAEMEKQRKIFQAGAKTKGVPADEANSIFDLLEKFANYGFNKCVVGETLIADAATGSLHEARELFEQQHHAKVISLDDFKLTESSATSVMQNGIKPVYKLTTSLGKTLTATGNHPLRVLDGWRNLEDLSVGDRIAAPATLELQGQTAWEPHEAALLGWILAEGNTCHPCGAYLYSNDPEAVADMVQAAEQFDNTRPTVKLREDRNRTYDVYLGTGKRGGASGGRSGVRRWLESLGLVNQNATQKQFPAEAFNLVKDDLAIVLGRYWSGDGFVFGQGNTTPYAATSSHKLARQLQHLLLRFGVVSRVSEKTFAYKEGRTGYTVHVLGRRSVEAFLTHVAPHIVGKDAQLACLQEYLANTPPHLESIDTLPPEVKTWVQEAKERSGLTWRELEAQSGVCTKEFYGTLKPHKKGFRRETIRKLAEFFDSEKLRSACSSDLFWETVVSIEAAGEAMTYDLEVAYTHNFIADDLVVHNSHSAAYGALSYQTAYLKAHYPVEFAAALLTVERANSDKVAEYAADARHLGIDVLPPDINESRSDFTPVEGVIRFGLYGIKNVGDAAVEHILEEREKGNKFKDLWDFCKRIDSSLVNKRAAEHLIKAGAFDEARGAARDAGKPRARHEVGRGAAQPGGARTDGDSLAARTPVPPALGKAEPLSDLELLEDGKRRPRALHQLAPDAKLPRLGSGGELRGGQARDLVQGATARSALQGSRQGRPGRHPAKRHQKIDPQRHDDGELRHRRRVG